MNQGATANCPSCGTAVRIGLVLENVTFVNNGMNVAVHCPRCQLMFDAAPGDGTFSTIGGRIRLVTKILARSDRVELLRLQQDLEYAKASADADSVARALDRAGVPAPNPGGWFSNQANRMEVWTILACILPVLIALLALLPADRGMSPQEVESVVDRVIEQVQHDQPSVTPPTK